MDNDSILKWVFWITITVLVALEIVALDIDSHYKYDFIFLVLLLVGIYLARKKIYLHWFHLLLFSLFLIIHDLGMFQLYESTILGLEYDHWVHGFFGLLSALILLRIYNYSGIEHGWMKYVMVIVIILGFSAAHELYEFGGAVLLGEGEGVLFIGAGDLDEWDTQKDMLNNFLGGLIGIALYHLTGFDRERRKKT